jgi:acyl phosphate:glycerol-3-phosphate acyltransferase
MSTLIFIAAASYLLGSIPFGYLLVRIFRGEDVRRSGSGNIGATNVARKSPVLGAITLLLDAAKGSAAVAMAAGFSVPAPLDPSSTNPHILISLAALFAIVGHMFPVWLKFRGGKGVATALGSFALIAPKAVLVAAVIFFVVALIFRYVSLASIIAVATFPVLAWLFHEYGSARGALAFMSLSSLLIIGKHHANIRRLVTRTEPRFGSKRSPQNAAEVGRSENR